ncbi:MAG: stage V sporulation protein AE [Clostridia bacterium]|nr:stage V sporulation protein AE [Clostridia bacterium]
MDFIFSLIKAFAVGGTICLIAQILIDKTAMTPARILVLYVSLGVILTGIGLYEPLVSFAGCGATTPLLGFGYSLAKGVRKAVDERGLIGALTGGLTGTAAGIAAAAFFGYLFALIFRGHPKK